MAYLKIFGGIVLTALLILIGLARTIFEIIGASTAPDDFTLLKQRMPKLLEWLFTTPWMVPTILLVLIAFLAAWLLVSGTKKAATEGIAEAEIQNHISEDDVRAIVAEQIAATNGANSKSDDSGSSILENVRNRLDKLEIEIEEIPGKAPDIGGKIMELIEYQRKWSQDKKDLRSFIERSREQIPELHVARQRLSDLRNASDIERQDFFANWREILQTPANTASSFWINLQRHGNYAEEQTKFNAATFSPMCTEAALMVEPERSEFEAMCGKISFTTCYAEGILTQLAYEKGAYVSADSSARNKSWIAALSEDYRLDR